MKRIKQRFTLAEILVSMIVFSILLVLMMQFFTGARTLWIANEKRSTLYSDATVAMDLMSMMLQSTYYGQEVPFAICNAPTAANDAKQPNDGWDSKIYFVSNSPMKLSKGGSVRYLSFQRGSDGNTSTVSNNVLYLKIFSDSSVTDPPFDQFFHPFGGDVSNDPQDVEAAREKLITVLNGTNSGKKLKTEEQKPILRNVTGLKFTPVNSTGEKFFNQNANDINGRLPVGIEIELSLMENETAIQNWQNAQDKNDYRVKNEQTFRRIVWLGDRTYQL